MSIPIAVIGTLDTKGDEFLFVKKEIEIQPSTVQPMGVQCYPDANKSRGKCDYRAYPGEKSQHVDRSGGFFPALERIFHAGRTGQGILVAGGQPGVF